MIQIDVHLAGENLINTSHDFHARFTYGPGPNISHGSRRQPFAIPHKDETSPYTWAQEKSWQPKIDWPDHCLGSPHSPSLMTALE
jgi:hypothetical protein